MSLYADYLFEREGKNLVEFGDTGFIVYEIKPPFAYLQDVYVAKMYRGNNIFRKLEDAFLQIAKTEDCNIVLTSLSLKDKNWQRSKHIIRDRGYKFFRLDKPTYMIYFSKGI